MFIMKNFTCKKYKYLIISLMAALTFALFTLSFLGGYSAAANSNYSANIFLPSTALEYYALNNPIDVYSDEQITAIAQDDQTLLISKDGAFEKVNASFTIIKQINKLDDNTLLVSDNGPIYKIDLTTLTKTDLKDSEGNIVSGNYFDLNQNYLVTAYNNQAIIYTLNSGTLTKNITFPANGNSPVTINSDDLIFYVNDGNIKMATPSNLISPPTLKSGVNPKHMIADKNYLYYVENQQISRIELATGTETNLIVDGNDKYELSNLISPSGITFKNGNLFIADTELDAVQEFEIVENKLCFTGYAITSGKTAYNRITSSASNIDRYLNKIAVLDQNRLSVITTSDTDKYSPDNYNNYFAEDLGGTLPDAFTLGKDYALLSFNHGLSLKILPLSSGEKIAPYAVDVPNSGIVEDIFYQSGYFYIVVSNSTNSRIYQLAETTLTPSAPQDTSALFSELFSIEKTVIDATHIAVDVFKNVYLADNNANVKLCVKENAYAYTNLDSTNISNVIKMQTDLGGNLFVLTSNGIYNYSQNQFNSIDLLPPQSGDQIKSFAMDFDKNEVFVLYANKEYICVANEVGNISIENVSATNDLYVITSQTANINQLKFATIKEGANKYSVVRNGNNFDYKGLTVGTDEYVIICDIAVNNSLTLTALAEKNGVILVNKNEINEYAPEQKAAPQSAFITTDVNAYYLPIINAKTEYALSSTDKIRLEKGAKINPSCTITVKSWHNGELLNVDFYFAQFEHQSTLLSGYIPVSFTVEVLAQNFVWENYSIEKISSTTLYSDEDLTNELDILDAGDIRLISKNNGVAKIAVQTQSGFIVGYIDAGAILNAPNTAVRNILIILAVSASICGTATYFIMRKKD